MSKQVYRAVQNFARFYAWFLVSRGASKVDVAEWNALKSHLATARKLMRLGKPIEHLQAALRTALAPGPAAEQLTAVARQLAYFIYLSLDALAWVCLTLVAFILRLDRRRRTLSNSPHSNPRLR